MESTKHSLLLSQPASTQFPQSSTQQAGYMGQRMGCTQPNLFGQHNNLYPSSDILTESPFLDKREVILREIEKERIRAQLIVSEIAKMHVLDGEINKDLSQVEAAKLRVSELKSVTQNEKEKIVNPAATISGSKSKAVTPTVAGTSKHPSDNIIYEKVEVIATSESGLNETSLKAQRPGKNSNIRKIEKGKKHLRCLKEIMQKGDTGEGNQKENIEVLLDSVDHVSESGKSLLPRNFDVVMDEARLELRKPVDASVNGFENLPVQIWSADRRVSEVSPLTKNGYEEEKIIFVDNHDVTVFGSKLKAVTLLPIADASECPSDIILHKKSDGEQGCGYSQVNVTSESALNEHLLEKKHRCKEISLKPRSPGKNCRIDNMLEKTELPDNPKPEKDQAKTLQTVQRSPDPKNIMHNIWCEMCQVGASSEIVMNNHEKGKKHVKRMKDRAKNGKIVPSNENEKMAVSVTCVQHVSEGGKNIISENVDVYEKGSHKFVFEGKTKEEERGLEVTGQDEIAQGVDIIVPKVDLTIDAILPEDDDIIAKGKWSCDLCQVFAITISALNEFLLGRNQKLKEASLKIPPPGRDSSVGNIAADTSLPKETESLENSKSNQLKIIQSQKNDDPKTTTDSFWPEKCQVGTLCKKNINGCEEEIVQNGESESCIGKEKIDEPVNCDKHISEDRKIVLSNNVDVVSAEAILELENTLDTSDDGFETFLIQIGAVDHRFSDVKPVSENAKEEEIVHNGDSEPCIEKKIEEPVNCDKHIYEGAESILSNNVDMVSNNVDVVSAEARLELEQALDTSDIGFETFLIQVGTVDIRVSEVKPVAENGKEEEIVQNGESDPYIEKEKIEERDKHISEFGKSILLNNVDVVSAEARLELEKPLDTFDIGFETSPIQFGTVDLRVSEVKPVAEEDEIVQNSESEPCIEKEKIGEPMNCDKHISEGGKGIVPNNVGEISAESRLRLESPLDTSCNGSETSLIQFRIVDLKVSNVNPVAENDDKEESILVVNPDADSSKCPTDIILYKKAEGERSFVESALTEQLSRKKHKLEEASLKSQSPGKNSNIVKISHDTTILMKKTGGLENPKSDNFKKDPSVQKKGDPKKKKDNFLRERRRIRTSSGKVVIDEEKGRKDANHLKDNLHNSEPRLCDQKENIEVSVDYDAHKGKRSIITDDVDVVSREARLELHMPLDASDNGFETLPTQIGDADLRVSEIKPVTRNGEKEEITYVASPDANKSGSKWKAVTPSVADISKSALNVVIDKESGRKDLNHLKEIVQNSETRSCNQKENIDVTGKYVENKGEISINSDNTDVLSAEARLELHKNLDASDNGFETLSVQIEAVDLRVPEVKPIMRNDKKKEIIFVANPDANISGSKCKAVTPTALKDVCEKKHQLKEDSLKSQCPVGNFSCDTLLSKETELIVNLKSDNHAKTIQSVQKNGDPKKTKEMLWCEKHQVGTSSDKIVNDDANGKKHNEIVQNGETEPCDHKEKIFEPVNRVKHSSEVAKSIFPHISKAAGVNIIKSGDSCSTLHAVSRKDGVRNSQGNWNCALCQVIAANESSLNKHLHGKKHKLKEASLKTQRAGNNSNMGNVAVDTLLEHPKSVNIIKDSAKTIRSVGKNGDLKKTKYSYWRGSCQVGPSEKVTYNLEKGKESAQNGPCNQEKMELPVNCAARVSESEKFSEAVSGQARLELPKPLEASNNGSHKRVEKQNEKRWKIKKNK